MYNHIPYGQIYEFECLDPSLGLPDGARSPPEARRALHPKSPSPTGLANLGFWTSLLGSHCCIEAVIAVAIGLLCSLMRVNPPARLEQSGPSQGLCPLGMPHLGPGACVERRPFILFGSEGCAKCRKSTCSEL